MIAAVATATTAATADVAAAAARKRSFVGRVYGKGSDMPELGILMCLVHTQTEIEAEWLRNEAAKNSLAPPHY